MSTVAELEAKIAQYKAELAAVLPVAGPLKLDIGCGNAVRRGVTGMTKEKGWTGVDLPGTDGADIHCDLATERWPWADSSVDEINCAHMLEHVPAKKTIQWLSWAPIESSDIAADLVIDAKKPGMKVVIASKDTYPRVHFINELWRVLKNGAKATIVTPHWCSCRAYADITHEWPPVSEMFWSYLNKEWRDQNAPHVGFNCHFDVGYGYLTATWLQAEVANRNPEFVQQRTHEALTKYKEAAQDMFATLTARK